MTQAEALTILKTGANVFLTGEPGAGKSHTVREYVHYLRTHGIEPAITASTGIAATHIGGLTIHSWSGIGIAKALTKYEIREIGTNDRVAKRMRNMHVLIIDEVSMLDANTLGLVDAVLRGVRENHAPFGGMQVIFVGDFFQLPPVSREGEMPSEFAFTADAWQLAKPVICYLHEQHRQEDPDFLAILSSMRSGNVPEEHRERLMERWYHGERPEDITKLFPHNADVDRINAAQLAKIPGEAKSFKMVDVGNPKLCEALRRGCLSPEKLDLKPGARVMFTRNNFEDGYVNGTTGEVEGFSKDTGFPMVKIRSGRIIEAKPASWAIEGESRSLAAITQIPLRLAWAMTVHKSQGMSLDAAYVDLSGAFAYGQGYVALSRVRTLEGLFLGGINERALEVDQTVLAKDGEFRAESDEARAKYTELSAEKLELKQKGFVVACGGRVTPRTPIEMLAAPLTSTPRSKEPRYAHTLALLLEGKSIAEVAAERGRKAGTIIEHLEKLKELGGLPKTGLEHIQNPKAMTDIHAAFKTLKTQQLSPVLTHLNRKYSYDDIKLARIFYS
jgi:ATP-dependent DNA helicase PIF1